MSCYLREEDLVLITPTSVRYDVMRAEDMWPCGSTARWSRDI